MNPTKILQQKLLFASATVSIGEGRIKHHSNQGIILANIILLDRKNRIVYMDAIRVKGRATGHVLNKAVYLAIGITNNLHHMKFSKNCKPFQSKSYAERRTFNYCRYFKIIFRNIGRLKKLQRPARQ